MVAVALGEGLERAEAADGVLDEDATAGEGGVEGAVFRWAWLRPGFASRGGAGRMKRLDADVGEVTQDADLGRQAFGEPGRAQQRQVTGRATDARRDVHDPPALVDGDLDLE